MVNIIWYVPCFMPQYPQSLPCPERRSERPDSPRVALALPPSLTDLHILHMFALRTRREYCPLVHVSSLSSHSLLPRFLSFPLSRCMELAVEFPEGHRLVGLGPTNSVTAGIHTGSRHTTGEYVGNL